MNSYIELAKELHAMAQAGLTYVKDPFDKERYERLAAIARDLMARLADAPIARVENFFLPESGYPTPKVDLRGGVFDARGRVLLVKERRSGRWSLPGGWADVNEPPSRGVEREVREEGGVAVRAVRLVGVKDRDCHPYTPKYPVHIYKLFFLCELIDVGENAGDDAKTKTPTEGRNNSDMEASRDYSEYGDTALARQIMHVHEIEAAGWFDPAALPPLSEDKTLAADIALLTAARANPSAPVSFD